MANNSEDVYREIRRKLEEARQPQPAFNGAAPGQVPIGQDLRLTPEGVVDPESAGAPKRIGGNSLGS